MLNRFCFLGLGLFLSFTVSATSISVLRGDDFRDDQGYRSSRTTLTIESFELWKYGTVFFYYDITDPTGRDRGPKYFSNQFFGGISGTLSLSRTTGRDMSYGILQDVSLRAEIENGSAVGAYNFQNYFYGLQYDLAVPGFDFFSFNTVFRDNPRVSGVGFQLGLFWQMSWEFERRKRFKFTGFLATSPWDGNALDTGPFDPTDAHGRFLSSQPQLLYDLGYALYGAKDKIEVGVEYAYFLNRFQFYKWDEKSLQAMVKVSF